AGRSGGSVPSRRRLVPDVSGDRGHAEARHVRVSGLLTATAGSGRLERKKKDGSMTLLPAALLIASILAPSTGIVPATATGKFVDQKWTVPITGAYAFRGKTGGFGDDEVIRVAVSNTKF